MDIERDLQRALRRTQTPPDLAGRVLARIASEGDRAQSDDDDRQGTGLQAAGRRGGFSGPMRWLAAAAAVTMVATGTFRYYEYQRTASEAERVKQEITLALQITSQKLALAQQRIERSAQNASR